MYINPLVASTSSDKEHPLRAICCIFQAKLLIVEIANYPNQVHLPAQEPWTQMAYISEKWTLRNERPSELQSIMKTIEDYTVHHLEQTP